MIVQANNGHQLNGAKIIYEYSDVKYSAKDYVQNGLVAMWDGIENAGYGVHDQSATTWKDLIGNNDIKILATAFGHFNKDHYETLPPSASDPAIGHAGKFITFAHAESVFSVVPASTNEQFTSFNQAKTESGGVQNNIIYHACYPSKQLLGFSKTSTSVHIGAKDTTLSVNQILCISTAYNTANCTVAAAYKNALPIQFDTCEEGALHNAGGYFTLGGRKQGSGWNTSFKGRLYNVRLYSRVLSQEEVIKNYSIDKVRFGI